MDDKRVYGHHTVPHGSYSKNKQFLSPPQHIMEIENKIIEKLCITDKYLHIHLGALLVFLVSFYCDFCPHTMLLQTGHNEQGFKDHVSTLHNTHKHHIHLLFTQPMKNHYIAYLDCTTCFLIKELGIKRTFRGKRVGKYRPHSWDQNKGV